MRLRYPATARNREPLLAVLRPRLPAKGTVLEIASGSGEHAVSFGAALPHLRWQPSDIDPDARASIAAWVEHEGLANVLPPVALDVTQQPWPVAAADAVLCVNMIHIAPWEATQGLLAGAAGVLPPGAPLLLYGPYVVDGETAPSNREFDESLRRRDPRWGVRELRDVEHEAADHGLALVETVAMPANNLVVVLRRGD
jgi:SAM-dependent methyltransferase